MKPITTALARLGVTAVAAATIGSGLVLLAPPAPAATTPATAITLTPATDTAAVGTCNKFVAAVTPDDGSATITVQLAQVVSGATVIGFCDPNQPSTGSSAPNSGSVSSGTATVSATLGDNGSGDYSASKGTVAFGVFSTKPTVAATPMTITATGATNVSDSSAKTWIAGGASQAAKVTCTPATATLQGGTTRTFTCTVTTAQDVTLAGISVLFYVKTGPNATSASSYKSCTGTDNSGVASCSYAGGSTAPEGTDTAYVWVDRNGDHAAQTGEPNTTVSTTWVRTAPSSAALSVLCDHNTTSLTNGSGGAYNQSSECQYPTHDTAVGFIARVINTANAQPVPGVTVSWSITSTTSGESGDVESVSPATCITGSAGTCSTTLTDTHPKEAEHVVMTGSISRVDGTHSTATGTVQWHDPGYSEARNIVVTPRATTRQAAASQPMTAVVTDRFGNPVPGAMVLWSESGPGRFSSGTSTEWELTDGNGRTVVTASASATDSGVQTVNAALYDSSRNTGNYASGHIECAAPAGSTYVSPASSSSPGLAVGAPAGNCSDSTTVTWTAAPVHPAIGTVHQPSTVAGTTVTMSGKGPVGGVVSLYVRNATTGGSFMLLATVPVDMSGNWSYQFNPAYQGSYYVTSGSGDTLEKSAEVIVTVTVKVTIDRLVPWGVDSRGLCLTRFLGGVFPFVPGAPVWVRNSAVVPTQPIGFTRVYQQGGSGRYDAAFGLRCGQAYSLFALISGVGSDGARYAGNGVSPNMPWRGR